MQLQYFYYLNGSITVIYYPIYSIDMLICELLNEVKQILHELRIHWITAAYGKNGNLIFHERFQTRISSSLLHCHINLSQFKHILRDPNDCLKIWNGFRSNLHELSRIYKPRHVCKCRLRTWIRSRNRAYVRSPTPPPPPPPPALFYLFLCFYLCVMDYGACRYVIMYVQL